MSFKIVRNDITKMKVDAIVNTANPNPVIGSGTDSAIYEVAGEEQLLAERKKIGKIEPGQAFITAGYHLPSKYIIHTVGPVWKGGNNQEEKKLRSCFRNSLELANKKQCESIALPLISTGNYHFPKDLALSIALNEINQFLLNHEMMVYLVVFDDESYKLSERLFSDIESYIDSKYIEKNTGRKENSNRARILLESSSMDEMSYPLSAKAVPSLEEVLKHSDDTFQQMLFHHIKEKGMKNVEVYKKANLSKKLFSKIKQNVNYKPSKETAIALSLALELNLDQATDLMKRAGYAFSPSSKFDLVIQYFIENKMYDVYTIDVALFDHELPMLSNYD